MWGGLYFCGCSAVVVYYFKYLSLYIALVNYVYASPTNKERRRPCRRTTPFTHTPFTYTTRCFLSANRILTGLILNELNEQMELHGRGTVRPKGGPKFHTVALPSSPDSDAPATGAGGKGGTATKVKTQVKTQAGGAKAAKAAKVEAAEAEFRPAPLRVRQTCVTTTTTASGETRGLLAAGFDNGFVKVVGVLGGAMRGGSGGRGKPKPKGGAGKGKAGGKRKAQEVSEEEEEEEEFEDETETDEEDEEDPDGGGRAGAGRASVPAARTRKPRKAAGKAMGKMKQARKEIDAGGEFHDDDDDDDGGGGGAGESKEGAKRSTAQV